MRSRFSKPPLGSPSDPARTTTCGRPRLQVTAAKQPTKSSAPTPTCSGSSRVPALAAQVEHRATVDAAERLLAAIAAVIDDFDADNPGLLPTDMLAAGSAATWLGLAHYAMSGRLP
jgi:hypothetical protein